MVCLKTPGRISVFFSFWVILESFKDRQKAPRAINLRGDLSTLDFWPKIISSHLVMHIKATKTLWFALKIS